MCMFLRFLWTYKCVYVQTICGAASLRWGLHLIGYWGAVRLWAIFIILVIILRTACWGHTQIPYKFIGEQEWQWGTDAIEMSGFILEEMNFFLLNLLSHLLLHIHATHHHVPMAALSRGTAVRRQVEAQRCSTSVMPQWSYGGLPQSAWSAAGPRRSSPMVSCKNTATLCWTLKKKLAVICFCLH